jgi:hypothetical protein
MAAASVMAESFMSVCPYVIKNKRKIGSAIKGTARKI